MNSHVKTSIILIIIGLLGIMLFKFLTPIFDDFQQQDTSDAKGIKGKIVIGYDNWVGYFPLCSPEMKKRMRQTGYLLECVDDNADYVDRYKKLSSGKYDFAVGTVDSYIINGEKEDYPGVITAVIDESKGGDAIVAWEDVITSLDDLKTSNGLRIAYTPDSPSDHLLKAVSVHFDIPKTLQPIEANGSNDALDKLLAREVDVAILWEPAVSRAISKKGIKRIISTKDTNQLIVDILIANRKLSDRKPELVTIFLKQYFKTLKYYRDNEDVLIADIAKQTKVDKTSVKSLLNGVEWSTLTDNAQRWYGTSSAALPQEALIDTIDSTVEILTGYGSVSSNPIPDGNPYRITNSEFIKKLYDEVSNTAFGSKAGAISADSLIKEFVPISDKAWNNLSEIGTLKVRPIIFASGTASLTIEGKQQLDSAAENLKHYPNYRVEIHGHTGTRGDKKANKTLSADRADSVKRYLAATFDVDVDRIRAIGFGAEKPLAKNSGESSRAYNYRLPRVELKLVAEEL